MLRAKQILRHTHWQNSVIILFLLVFFLLAVDTARKKTATADEPVHVARGYALWHTRDLRLQIQPPLSHWLNHLFIWFEPTLPELTTLDSWPSGDRVAIAHEFFWEQGMAVSRVLFLARLPIIFLALLTGAILTRWSRERYGSLAAYFVLFLFAFSPNTLAFAALSTTDLPTTAITLTAIYALWRYQEQPTWLRWALTGIILGLAFATKVSTLILLPLTLLLLVVSWQRDRPLRHTVANWVSLLFPAALVFWALYQFELRLLPDIPWPVPAATYVDDFLHVQEHIERGYPAFLLGQRSSAGWWYYFFVAFLIKTPLPALILILVGLLYLLRQWPDWRQTIVLWATPASLFLAASFTGFNIGYRHVLPALPFLWLIAAAALPWWRRSRLTLSLLLLLLIWYAVGTVNQHPHYLATFNELVGGSANGYRYLGDSNIDWGQDLNLLAAHARNQDEERFHYSYFGVGDPDYYGLHQLSLLAPAEAAVFSPANPSPGQYALSVNHVQGTLIEEPDLFNWFWRQQPAGTLGYSILLYDVPASAPGSWIAHCLDPAPLLDPDQAASLVGREKENVRHVYFDCRQSWVFPGGGEPGWYILPQQAEPWLMADRFPEHLRQVYAHAHTAAAPSYDVYYWQGDPALAQSLSTIPADVREPDGTPVPLPVVSPTANVRLLGYRSSALTEWLTAWEVTGSGAPGLTIAAHLYSGGAPQGIADGLGFSSEQWQSGDIFAQFHTFSAPDFARDSSPFLATGVYSYLSGEHFPFTAAGRALPQLHLYPASAAGGVEYRATTRP